MHADRPHRVQPLPPVVLASPRTRTNARRALDAQRRHHFDAAELVLLATIARALGRCATAHALLAIRLVTTRWDRDGGCREEP